MADIYTLNGEAKEGTAHGGPSMFVFLDFRNGGRLAMSEFPRRPACASESSGKGLSNLPARLALPILNCPAGDRPSQRGDFNGRRIRRAEKPRGEIGTSG